jgi:hypothetical protein
MTNQLRTQADQTALAESMAENYTKPGVHFYEKGRARFVPVAAFTKTRMPQKMIVEITAELLMADLKKTAFAMALINGKLQLERVDIG